MQRIAREEEGASRGQPCYEEKKRDEGKGQRGRGREDRVERRSERTAGKIGGGSQQLLAGMSGNAWDSDPKGPTTTNVREALQSSFSLSLSLSDQLKERDRYRLAGRSLFEICLGGLGEEGSSLCWADGKGEAVGLEEERRVI